MVLTSEACDEVCDEVCDMARSIAATTWQWLDTPTSSRRQSVRRSLPVMRPDSVELPVGVVFRRLRSADRTVDGGWTWFGLCDLAADGTGLLATAAIRRIGAGVVELCAVTAASPQVGDRLLREVADALRADGAERIVAALPDQPELLRRAGFCDGALEL
jgi:hypothetical protein